MRSMPPSTGRCGQPKRIIQDLQSRAEKAAIQAAQEIADAKEKFKGTEYQAVERTGKFKGKRGDGQSRKRHMPTTFRNAKEAYFEDEAKGIVKPKPDDALQALLWEMGELKAKVSEADKGAGKANRSTIQLWNAQFNLKNEQRKALAKKLDAIEAKQAQYWDEQAAKLRVKYHEWLSKLVEEDKLTADEAFDIRNSFVDQETMVKRKRRTRITDPAIKRVLRELPPPAGFYPGGIRRDHREQAAGQLAEASSLVAGHGVQPQGQGVGRRLHQGCRQGGQGGQQGDQEPQGEGNAANPC